MAIKNTRQIEIEVDEVLADMEFDPQGKGLFVALLIAFEKEFGFVPDRRQFAAFLARADSIAAEHIKALDG